jgi:hypothetical protein
MTRDELRTACRLLRQKVLDHDVLFCKAAVILSASQADELAFSVLRLLDEIEETKQ